MPRRKLEQVTSVLRDRIRDATEIGAIKVGGRLPGTRRLAGELLVDQRLVALAFRRLEQEGVVEIRPRSGAYVAPGGNGMPGNRSLPRDWTAEVVAQAVERGISAQRLPIDLGRLTDSYKLRATAVAATSDQAVGIVRELQQDYGIAAAAVFPEQIAAGRYPSTLLSSQLLVTTADLAPTLREVAASLSKPLVVVRVRPDLFSEDWIAFMNGRVYVIVADPRFRAMLKQVLRPVPRSANVTILLAGRDDISRVPRDARTYVTESARRMLGRGALPGRIIRPRRVFSSETVREIAAFLVQHNAARRAR